MKNLILHALVISAISACSAMPTENASAQEVFKPVGSRQCEPGSGASEGESRAELEAARIPILGYRQGHDGRVYPAVCGAPTGRLHVFTIPAAQMPVAAALGYRPVGD